MYQFIIDTDSYAGNFERELCGYCTGHWDNETHGGVQSAMFKEEVGDPDEYFENVAYTTIEDASYPFISCVTIVNEPTTKQCNSVAIFFDEKPTKKQIELMKQRAERYASEGKDILGRPLEFKVIGYRLIQKIEITRKIEIKI